MRKILIGLFLFGAAFLNAQELKFAPDPSGGVDTGNFWNILGNSGTTTSNFIGTLNPADMILKANAGYGVFKIDTLSRIVIANNSTADSIIRVLGLMKFNMAFYDSVSRKLFTMQADTTYFSAEIANVNGTRSVGVKVDAVGDDYESFLYMVQDSLNSNVTSYALGGFQPSAELNLINMNTGLDIAHFALTYDTGAHVAMLDQHITDSTGTDMHIHYHNREVQPTPSMMSWGTQDNPWLVGYFDSLNVGYPKIYTAILSQSGTDAPTAVVLKNTIGNIVWTRNTTGDYTGTLSGVFAADATVFFTNSPYYILSNMARLDNNSVGLTVSDVSTNTQVDNVSNISIEIRVY